MYTHAYTHTHTRAHTVSCIHASINTEHTHTHIDTRTRTHTHTHTHTLMSDRHTHSVGNPVDVDAFFDKFLHQVSSTKATGIPECLLPRIGLSHVG